MSALQACGKQSRSTAAAALVEEKDDLQMTFRAACYVTANPTTKFCKVERQEEVYTACKSPCIKVACQFKKIIKNVNVTFTCIFLLKADLLHAVLRVSKRTSKWNQGVY